MGDEQHMVAAFHRAFDIVIGTHPVIPDDATCALRLNLIQEEFDELREALTQRDLEAIAKELADLLYVVYGTAVSYGIDMTPVFQEVHRSNMSKVGGHKRADGKWLKPPDYSPAQIQPLLAAQGLQPMPAALQTEDNGPGRLVRRDNTRMRERLPRQCPRCHKHFVRRSHRTGIRERLLGWLYLYPFRCQVCGQRFKAFQFRASYSRQLIDRRQYERLPTHFPLVFAEAVKPGEERLGTGIVTDLSLGGCFVQTLTRLAEGAVLSLELQIHTSDPVLSVEAALVRSVRPIGVGLEFLRLANPEQQRLSRYLRRLHAAQDEAEAMPN